MKGFKLFFLLCCFISMARAIDQQLLMFLHTQNKDFGEEEGLNVAYQALTAIMQKAAPILMSENIWQHVVERKDRFLKGLKNQKSIQNAVLQMYQDVNLLLKKNKGNVAVANSALGHAWYQKEYAQLHKLESYAYKHLLFDYFCFYIFDHLNDWKVYQLKGDGYLLWIPHNHKQGFWLKDVLVKNQNELKKAMFMHKSLEINDVLQKYIHKDKSIHWTCYATGHGYHQDDEHVSAGIAGMALPSLKKLLLFFNDECSCDLFVYSSCFGAGQHAIIPYQDNDTDLLLSYPVVIISLTDAPSYVFGAPSGFKLPPYHADNFLTVQDGDHQGLKNSFLQNFKIFCQDVKIGKINADLIKTINPYIQCSSLNCFILKIENLPLIRRAYSSFFVPLDGFQVFCLTTSKNHDIDLAHKVACLWYINNYPGTIHVSSPLPAFISMIPGGQVHYAQNLKATGVDFGDLIRSLFLSIDDIQEQNIYFFDKMFCSAQISEISSYRIEEFEQVLILPTGQWMPAFAQDDQSCYVYVCKDTFSYCICFDQNKQISLVQKLNEDQMIVLNRFKELLHQESILGRDKSMQTLLSCQYFKQRDQLQQDLLQQCLHEKICK